MSFFTELKRRNVIRVALAYILITWVLLQAADFGLDVIEAPNWVIQTLFLLAAIGLPGVLVFSWVFEMTPEGLKREKEVDRDESIAGKTGRKLNTVIFVAMAIAVSYLLVDKLTLQEQREPNTSAVTTVAVPDEEAIGTSPDIASIAVLPFVNMSRDPDNEYFSDGLTDTLLHMLAQLPDLRVAARTSSFAFKGQNKAISDIAKELNVAHVLEGSVQRAGEQVRVTAQLIRAGDGFHAWSQSYTRPMQDIFAIQDEIASDVASALGASLLGGNKGAIRGLETSNLDAFDYYLRGLDHQSSFTYSSLEDAENDLQQALIIDPAFMDARMALVRNYFLKRLTGILDNEKVQQFARPMIDQIMTEDPENRQIELYDNMLSGRWTDNSLSRDQVRDNIYVQRELLARIPTDSFMRREVASGLEAVLNEPEAALDLLETGLLIDPLYPDLHLEKGRVLIKMERLDEAEASLLRGIELKPELPTGYTRMAFLSQKRGDYPGIIRWRRASIERDPQDHELVHVLAEDFYDLGLLEEADRWYTRLSSLAPGSALARSLEVRRAFERGDAEFAREAAWRAIEDEIGTRQGAHNQVTIIYTHLMMEAGRSEEAFRQIVAFRPEISNWSSRPSDGRGMDLQIAAVLLHFVFAGGTERQAAWNTFIQTLDETGWSWDKPGNRLVIIDAVISGDIDAAFFNLRDHRLNGPITERPNGHRQMMRPLFETLYNDPRMLALSGQRDRDLQQARTEIEDLLLTPEWIEP